MQTSAGDSRQSGMTMLEMVIATMMLMLLSFLVTSMIISGNAAQKYSERLGRVTEISQEILDDIQGELRAAVRLFGNDALGNAYKARIEAWPQAVRARGGTPIRLTPLLYRRPDTERARLRRRRPWGRRGSTSG